MNTQSRLHPIEKLQVQAIIAVIQCQEISEDRYRISIRYTIAITHSIGKLHLHNLCLIDIGLVLETTQPRLHKIHREYSYMGQLNSNYIPRKEVKLDIESE